jgi:DNA-binding NtrC family response regulator
VVTQVLLMDPDPTITATLARLLGAEAAVTVCADFHAARQHLVVSPPDLLVTQFRLREYNGLHLVYLAAALDLPTRSVVYTDTDDLGTGRAIQVAGAFYETRARLTLALPAYLSGRLPRSDRREVEYHDRRREFRGGRRTTDRGLAT